MSAEATITVALAGNPNSGKSTIFNCLTGLRQHVGNWPGKTVESKRGRFTYRGHTFDVIDLPGTYSLAAYSGEEAVTRDCLLTETPDLIVLTLDATNLERHLYLALQVLEMGIPAVLALNMSDLADRREQFINLERLSGAIGGIPVLRVAANKGEGIEALKECIWDWARSIESPPSAVPQFPEFTYPPEIENELRGLAPVLDDHIVAPPVQVRRRWLALELLANGKHLAERLDRSSPGIQLLDLLDESRQRVQRVFPDGAALRIADARYGEVARVVEASLEPGSPPIKRWSDRIDSVVTHPILGVPIFLMIMYLLFKLVVDISAPYLDWIDAVVSGPLSAWGAGALSALSAPAWLRALVVEGVIAGVGGVLVFLPGLVALFLFIAILEDSGYLARAAFVMNRFLTFLGLNGKSFVPLILGFGCAVPAIFATRTLGNRRDRLLTALMVPLMSCSARLPVYVLFGMALFGRQADLVIWGLYALGVVVSIMAGWLLSRTILRAESPSEFLMELPGYRLPAIGSLWRNVSYRTADFIKSAGSVILLASIAIWGLLHIPFNANSMEQSAFGRVSAAIAPVFRPAGFGTWEATASLMSGLVAKEVVVSTMAEIYIDAPQQAGSGMAPEFGDEILDIVTGFGTATVDAAREAVETLTPGVEIFSVERNPAPNDTALGAMLASIFSPRQGFAFLIYVLLYTPCIATLGVIRSEFGARWAVFSALYQSGIAWLAATAFYQLGSLFA